MDYDDNDFQSQSFQLIGEENDEFHRSLQSYAPPKFDIDDHFHAPIRFDSLSEMGLLLGIQGEENSWMEEFSPRNSAVEFGSSAAQTCSISGHDNIRSNAPSSESAQLLVNSVGNDEAVSPQVMNTAAETHAIGDSSDCGSKSIVEADSTLLTGKFHKSILGSNEDVLRAEQHALTSQNSSDEKSEMGLDVSLSDKKFHSTGKVVALQHTTDEGLTSSSGDVSKACLVVGELVEVVQSNELLDNASKMNSSLDDHGCAVNRNTEVSPNFLSCGTQDGSSGLSTDSAGISTAKEDNPLLSEQKMEECCEVDLSETSEALPSENNQNETSYNLYGDCKLNDQHFHGDAINNVYDVKASSDLVSSSHSLMLPNEGSRSSVFFKNSVEAIDYQVKVLNKDLRTGDKHSTCTKEVPSLAMETDGSTGRNSVEVGTESIPELCGIAGSIDFSHGVHEYISKDDGLHPHASLTKESKTISFEEERNFATSKAVIDDNCSELTSSSDMAVRVEFSTPLEAEIRMKGVDGHNDCDPLSSKKSDPIQTEMSAIDESLKAITEKYTEKLDAPKHAILKEPCAALLDDAEKKLSSHVHDKLAPISDTGSLVTELKEDNVIHSEETEYTAQLIDSSVTHAKNCNDVFEKTEYTAQLIDSSGTHPKNCNDVFENTEISPFEAQNTCVVMESNKKSIMDQAEGVKSPFPKNSTILQHLNSELEAIAEQKDAAASSIPESCCDEKEVSISSLLVIKSNTDTQISRQPLVVPDSDANGPSIKNFSDGSETGNSDVVLVASSVGVSSLFTCQSIDKKDTNLCPTDNCDKLNFTETKTDALNSDGNNPPPSTLLESNTESCLLDPEDGNLNSFEPSCGSPTVISCNERTLEEIEWRESNSSLPDPASETTENSDILKGTAQDSKVSNTSEDDGNFTFVVQPAADLSQKDTNKNWKLFCNLQSYEQSQISKENSQGHLDKTIKETTSTISKTTEEDKRKQVSAPATRKGGISKGDAKEKSQEKHGKGRKKNPCSTSPVPDRATRSKTHTEGIQQCLHVETNTTKACSPSIEMSSPPDLNNLVPSALFNQPFTDLQQLQLRAQIFVYGSLIQGILSDEACMLTAFGGTDGGKILWEQAWRTASERLHNQKSFPSSCGTHLQYHSGISCSPLQSKTLNSPSGWRDSKFLNSAIQSSTVPSQLPLLSSFSDGLPSSVTRGTHLESNQSLSPLHSYQTSQIRQDLSNAAPSLSQSPRAASLFFSSPLDSSSQYSAIPIAVTAQVSPVRDSSIPCTSNMRLASPGALLPNQGAVSVSSALVVPVETQYRAADTVSTKNASANGKSRKRKKVLAKDELVPKVLGSQPQAESASAAVITNHIPTSVAISLSSNSPSTVTSAGLVSATPLPITLPYFQISGNDDTQQKVIFLKEISTQIEHSKLQAENASAYAAAAVRHSQVIWEQMANQRKSGMASEAEEKLASSAVAAAAAASVAKAAAEVAKVASDAVLQAKVMADEALNSANIGRTTQNSEVSLEIRNKLLTSTPVSTRKGKDKTRGSCSIILTARETTRDRVEAASAAMKRAENLNAILRAAEMAAEAVSQAGMVIAMGDPLPFSLSELVEAGLEGHWKVHRVTIGNGTETNDIQAGENLRLDVAGDHEIMAKQQNEQSLGHTEREKVSDVNEMSPSNKKSSLLEENYGGREFGNGPKTIPANRSASGPMQGSSIQKGSLVEVVVDVDGLRGAWFSAWVLDVKDGKAQVCYKDLSHKGTDKLKEWIPLESESDKPPSIRVPHPVIVAKSEGSRKRPREVLGNCIWAVGDRVDAWTRDGWWEGIIIEKSQDDETKLTVHFPVGGDSSIVRAWNLRHSLIWKDGQWMEWSRDKERGDDPLKKRQKLGQLDAKNKSEIDEGEMGTLSRNNYTDDSGKLDSRPLNLSAKDIIFSVGKNVGAENNTHAFKVRRAGLQKNGSKMVFGVPKPGKKRKFMEVSKHYNKDKTENATEGSDSVKFAKSLMPQASQLWRNISKVDVKGKRATNLNARGSKSLRSQNVQARANVDKEKLSVTTVSVLNGGEIGLGTSFSNEEKKSSMETGSFSHVLGKIDIAVIESSVQPAPGAPLAKKKPTSVEAEAGEKGKASSAVDKSNRSEVEGSENPRKRSADGIEPRRSNRKIQPTSRLLEGLQSSMITSKKS